MKFRMFFSLVCCILFFTGFSYGDQAGKSDTVEKENLNASPAVEKVTSAAPSAVVPSGKFEFEPVVDGTKVTHDFVIQNKGTGPLNIEKVKTG